MLKKDSAPYRSDAVPTGYEDPHPDKLRFVPLGGLGEFGKNMMVIEFGGDMIVVDCGQMFPETDMLGVYSVIPDFTYIHDHAHKLRALILTHGHEDHIGGAPHFLREFNIPVYASRFTVALMEEKLREVGLDDVVDLRQIEARTIIELGKFKIEFLRVTHSIPDAMALAITTPVGTIIHTGDYKLDASADEDASDFFTLTHYGESGVLALLADSTNVDRDGFSPSEEEVTAGLGPIIHDAPGAVLLTTFSSSLHRLQTCLDYAQESGRKFAVAGRSLERNFAIGTRLGLLKYRDDLVVPLKTIRKLPRSQQLLVISGCQGERYSALNRLSIEDYRPYQIAPNDTVVFSSRMIPGNERQIFRMINNLYRMGARVITERDARVHASGHAYRGEMRQLYQMLRPKFFIPVHGELRNLIGQRDLAASLHFEPENIFILENGDVLDLDQNKGTQWRSQLAGYTLVDGNRMENVEDIVLRDRQHLSEDGMITVILVVDRKTIEIVAGPDIVSRGFVEVDTNEELIDACREVTLKAFDETVGSPGQEWDVVKSAIRKALRKYLRHETDRYPLILPVIIEI